MMKNIEDVIGRGEQVQSVLLFVVVALMFVVLSDRAESLRANSKAYLQVCVCVSVFVCLCECVCICV